MHFSITRLLLAVTAFAIAFAAFGYLGIAGIVISAVTGASIGAIFLIVKPNQIWPMIRTALTTIVGGFGGLVFCPMVNSPYDPRHGIGYIGIGGLIGFMIGITMTASQNFNPDDANDRS